MKNPSGNKLEKLMFRLFDQMVEGSDKYVTKQGSTWLIFTEEKKWITEFTESGTLWFNYNSFQSELELIGKKCADETKTISRWFELRFLNKPTIGHTSPYKHRVTKRVEDTIQNGVKQTDSRLGNFRLFVDNAIKNGVKRTILSSVRLSEDVEDTIQNGVRHTDILESGRTDSVEDTIQNGVKETNPTNFADVEDTIQNGVKHIGPRQWDNTENIDSAIKNGVKDTRQIDWEINWPVENTIQNGVKDTKVVEFDHFKTVEDTTQNGVKEIYSTLRRTKLGVDDIIENGVKVAKPMDEWVNAERIVDEVVKDGVKEIKGHGFEQQNIIEDTIQNGVKEIKELPDKSGELKGYGDYYHRQENWTKPHTDYVKEVIEDHYHHMGRVEGIIRNTDKDGI